ncbi:unnamed protein product [Gongylonema pulchrum]|uniref:CASP-like protein n=1 Tax=Gongylonema pulchrum TaxID=637853 RepID=A0A183EAM1_9BILA|nr:unnamed protein product [Gongylonema pulchrum]
MRGLSEVLAALKKIMTGYHIGGIALSLAFLALKSTTGLCSLVFTECGLDYHFCSEMDISQNVPALIMFLYHFIFYHSKYII